jgi:hypothetical protein
MQLRIRLFFGMNEEWLGFWKQMNAGTLLYYFTTDEIDWSLLGGREGYVLIREGEIVAMLITALS